jgi:exopolysaccharide biosynthesis polyprenyl glycosylphosphotransferase
MSFMLYLIDLSLLYVSVVLSFLLRFGRHWPVANWDAAQHLLPYLLLIVGVMSYLMDLNVGLRRKRLSQVVPILVMINTVLFVMCLALSFWFRQFALPRSIAVTICLTNLILGTLFRVLADRTIQRAMEASRRRAAIVCADLKEGQNLKRQIASACIPVFREIREVVASADERVEDVDVDAVIIGPDLQWEERQRIALAALQSGKDVKMLPSPADLMFTGSSAEQMGGTLFLSLHPLTISKADAVAKRIIDILGSLLLIAVFSVFFVLLFVLVPLTSPGPALYRQTRVGLHGKEFVIYKFRTMVNNAERYTGPVLASSDDPRVTRFGRILRATRLDELPQLFNVLKGDMSLVGPRPERPEFVSRFDATIPGYSLRHVVRPGLTGLAQIMGDYSTEASEKLRYDLWYVRHYTPALDIKILVQTLFVVLNPRQARGVKTERVTLDVSVKS